MRLRPVPTERLMRPVVMERLMRPVLTGPHRIGEITSRRLLRQMLLRQVPQQAESVSAPGAQSGGVGRALKVIY